MLQENVGWNLRLSMKWSEVKWSEVKWSEVKWSEVRWGEVRWGEVRWGEVRWGEVRWGEVKWSEVKWGEVKWNLYARRQPVKGTGENKSATYTLMPFRWFGAKEYELWHQIGHRFASLATALQLPKCWHLHKFCSVVSQVFRGRPTVWCPLHVHIRMRDNQRSGGGLAAYCAKFQCISTQRTDQHFTEYCWTNCATRAFQTCKISCQGRDQSAAAGGPTTLRNSFRNTTSRLLRSFLKIARCPAIWKFVCYIMSLPCVLPFVGLSENRVVFMVKYFPMTAKKKPLHSCEDHVGNHLVEEPYVGNGAEIRHKFCAGHFGKHREQCFFHFAGGSSTLQNAIEETKQFHQEFVRNMLKKFYCQTTFITNFVDVETGARALQFSEGPVCVCLWGRTCCPKKLSPEHQETRAMVAVKHMPVLHLNESYSAMPSNGKLGPPIVSTLYFCKNGRHGDEVSWFQTKAFRARWVQCFGALSAKKKNKRSFREGREVKRAVLHWPCSRPAVSNMRASAGNVGFNSTGGVEGYFCFSECTSKWNSYASGGPSVTAVYNCYTVCAWRLPSKTAPHPRTFLRQKKGAREKKQNQQLRFSENLTSRFGRSIIPGPILTRIDRAGHQHWLCHLMDDCHAACGVTILGPFLPSLRTSARDPCHSKVGRRCPCHRLRPEIE